MRTNQSLGKFLSRNKTPICLYVGVIASSIIFPLFFNSNLLALQLGIITLSTTLFLGFLNYQHTQDRLFKDLFKEFNERYNILSDQFQHLESKYNADVKISDVSKEDLNNVISYLNLCAEEYFWFHKAESTIALERVGNQA